MVGPAPVFISQAAKRVPAEIDDPAYFVVTIEGGREGREGRERGGVGVHTTDVKVQGRISMRYQEEARTHTASAQK